MYNITVRDQYSPAVVTVPANMLSVEFPYNGTSIVANREYTITVSAISDQGTSYSSDPVVVSKCSYICTCRVSVCAYFVTGPEKTGLAYIHLFILYHVAFSFSTYLLLDFMKFA